MASLRYTARCLRDIRPATKSQWSSAATATLAIRPKTQTANVTRNISTTSSKAAITNNELTREPSADFAALEAAAQQSSSGETALVPSKAITRVPYARAVPVSPSYFSRQPIFNDRFVVVQNLAQRFARLPILPKDKVAPTAWRTREQYRLATGEQIKGKDYASCLGMVKRLNQIHPDLMPTPVVEGMAPFKRDVNPYLNRPKAILVDKFGRALGVGKRKASVARAYVVEGTGEVFVNGKPLSEAFGRLHDRESAVWALKSTERMDKYNVWALVQGGGTTGQAEALTLAVAKALCAHEPALKNPLRRGESTHDTPCRKFVDMLGNVSADSSSRSVRLYRHSHTVPAAAPASVSRIISLTFTQPDVSPAILEWWRGRSPVTSRPGKCRPGSRDSLGAGFNSMPGREECVDVLWLQGKGSMRMPILGGDYLSMHIVLASLREQSSSSALPFYGPGSDGGGPDLRLKLGFPREGVSGSLKRKGLLQRHARCHGLACQMYIHVPICNSKYRDKVTVIRRLYTPKLWSLAANSKKS